MNARTRLAAAAQDLAHPWPAVCAAPGIAVETVLVSRGAVAWRGGSPWYPQRVTALAAGSDAGPLLRRLARPGDHVMGSPEALRGLTGAPGQWQLRTVHTPLAGQPGQERVQWLDPSEHPAVQALLDAANPDAAFRPSQPGTGRWCGIRRDGVLVAAAAQTLPVAPWAHLSSLAVHPAARRQGLGAAVTAFFVAAGLAAGAPGVMLGVDADNPAGIALYDTLGFASWPLVGMDLPLRP